MLMVIRQLYCLCLTLLLLGCEQPAQNYYPLQAGHWWQYEIRTRTMDGEQTGKLILRNLPAVQKAGETIYYRQTASGEKHRYVRDTAGIYRLAVDAEGQLNRNIVLGLPRAIGTHWTGSITTSVLEKSGPPQFTLFRIQQTVQMSYRIESLNDEVRVKGKRYRNCLRVRGSGRVNANVANYVGQISIEVESDDWYAPGIGLVKSVHRESTSSDAISQGEYQLQLEIFEQN